MPYGISEILLTRLQWEMEHILMEIPLENFQNPLLMHAL